MNGIRDIRAARVGQVNSVNLRSKGVPRRSGSLDQSSIDTLGEPKSGRRSKNPTNHSTPGSDFIETALVGRLEELLILEIGKDGSRSYLQLSVRGLYKHVIACITNTRVPHATTNADLGANGDNNINDKRSEFGSLVTRSIRKSNTSNLTWHSNVHSPQLTSRNVFSIPPSLIEAQKLPVLNALHEQQSNNMFHDSSGSFQPHASSMMESNFMQSTAGIPEVPQITQKSPMISRPVPIGTAPPSGLVSSTSTIPKPTKRRGRNVTVGGFLPEEDDKPHRGFVPGPLKRSGSTSNESVDKFNPHLQQVTYRERLGAYIHPRDMRRLVTPFSASNEPELIVRRHVMLLNFDPLRAIILRDRLLVLVPDGADSILADLEQRIRGGADEVINSIFGNYNDDEGSNAGEGSNNIEIKFEKDQDGRKVVEMSEQDVEKVLLLKNNKVQKFEKASTSNRTLSSSIVTNESNKGDGSGISDSNTSTEISSGGNQQKTPSARKSGLPRSLSMNALGKVDDESTQTLIPPPPTEPPNPINAVDDNSNSSYNADEDDEWDEMEGREWIDLPFELQCVDAVLFVVGSMLSIETQEIRKSAEGCIHKLLTHDSNGVDGDHPLTSIRAVKDAVREMTSRVKGFLQSMTRILDEDEDMALMNLSRLLTHPHRFIQPVPQEVLEEESDEPELILEANLQIALSLQNSLDLIKGQIDTASELLDQKLDALRNRLLFANMLISICTLAVTAAAVVGSFFGMNIPNPLEETPAAWSQVTFGAIGGCILLVFLILFLLVYSGTIPRSSFRGI